MSAEKEEREKEIEKEWEGVRERVCVWERERERGGEKERVCSTSGRTITLSGIIILKWNIQYTLQILSWKRDKKYFLDLK